MRCCRCFLSLLALGRTAAADIAADANGRGVLLQLVVRGPAANATRQRWHALHDLSLIHI